ncbi:MAG: hypothetical protein ACRDQA_30655, partial [Nocardioidaceae bacterium]
MQPISLGRDARTVFVGKHRGSKQASEVSGLLPDGRIVHYTGKRPGGPLGSLHGSYMLIDPSKGDARTPLQVGTDGRPNDMIASRSYIAWQRVGG